MNVFKKQAAAYSFHGDASLADETPDPQGILAGLPSQAAAIAHVLVHGLGDDSKRAAVAKLPLNNAASKWFMAKGVSHYWNSMLHPPLSYRGDTFQFRSADGADNSILHPQLGKAGLPYAKSVPSKMHIPGARPDPGDLFDLLMARKNDEESKSGMSSMLLYHATVIIHDIFRSNPDDKNISDTSSYLDLSPLYGNSQAIQDTIRTKKLGLLKPDTFAEKRLLMQPPGVCIYIIMFNRFHNYVAKQLLEINENGKFALPFLEGSDKWNKLTPKEQQAMKDKQDEDLFQTARLITCGLYINISIHDYLRCLMGLHTKDTAWTLDPRIEVPGEDKTGLQRGIGNQVSVEFNLLYRFHSPISKRDREWSEGMFKSLLHKFGNWTDEEILNGDISVPKFKEIIDMMNGKGETKEDQLARERDAKYLPEGLEPAATGYKFKRDADTGLFNDAELVAEMTQVIEDPICQFGAQNVPKIFKAIEILGILQARKWEVATLNEFRDFFGLTKHKTFEDINADPGITDALRDLYENPDCVELYPGLLCEGTMRCLDPGTPGPNGGATALWSGVFSDAVTLVRSDRFYTVDWNIGSLTAWGMREVTSDPSILKGSVFHRLFQRAFPGHFEFNSVHLWQPLYTPAMNIVLAKEQGYLASLDFSKLAFDPKLGLPNTSAANFTEKLGKIKYDDLRGNVHRRTTTQGQVEAVPEPKLLIEISNYFEIRDKILGTNKAEFQNPGVVDGTVIPGNYLRAMMTGQSKSYDDAVQVFENLVTSETEQMFHDYFAGMSKEILVREQRKFQRQALYEFSFKDAREELQNLNLASDVVKKEQKVLDDLERQVLKQKADGKVFDMFSPKLKADLSKFLQVYQVDVVRDYAIPIITRFVADLLGFWDCIKTPANLDRPYTENQIYQLIHDSQDYLAYNSDETTMWKRRDVFKKSLETLKEKAEYGVQRAQGGFFGLFVKPLQMEGDKDYVVKLREFGVEASKALLKSMSGTEEVAAMMLVLSMEAAHKSVMTFTEVLAYFIDHPHEEEPDVSDWIEIQRLAYKNTPEADQTLKRYVLEAQRLHVDLPLVRVYKPAKGTTSAGATPELSLTNSDSKDQKKHVLQPGDKFLLELKEAQQYAGTAELPVFPSPSTLSLSPTDRPLENYLIYGQGIPSTFKAKDFTLIGLTAMLKHLATLRSLRVAHDKLGRLKRVETPYGVKTYMSVQWDQLVPFPTTWNLRFNGTGRGVYRGRDNADQGHGQNQVYQKPTAIPPGGTFKSGSGAPVEALATAMNGARSGLSGKINGGPKENGVVNSKENGVVKTMENGVKENGVHQTAKQNGW
ncbi:hypothetical protein MMC25_002613 [Agyrium rufum]|nr:hypothetical protein [Agyrium rufum]